MKAARRQRTIGFAVSFAWVALASLVAALMVRHGWETSLSAVGLQWVMTGVLPPVLAMASLDPVPRPARIGGWPPHQRR